MKGQWTGQIDGEIKQLVILNADELNDKYKGYLHVVPFSNALPTALSFIETKDKTNTGILELQLSAINPDTGNAESWQKVQKHFGSDVRFSEQVNIRYQIEDDHMDVHYNSEVLGENIIRLVKGHPESPSSIKAEEVDWDGFKAKIKEYLGRGFLFRGQNEPWRLRTSFHRSGRYDLLRYLTEDLKILHRHLSSKTSHIFDLNNFDELGSFMYLAQHHGYPTPLLDWTYSPYVAAFFAYRGLTAKRCQSASSNDKVRIFVFDRQLWHQHMRPIPNFLHPHFNLTVSELLGIDNQRMMPQQSVTTTTNVDDIEGYITSNEIGRRYLFAFDLLYSERSYIIEELSYMGITAGSLFPGIDGICEELKQRHFGC